MSAGWLQSKLGFILTFVFLVIGGCIKKTHVPQKVEHLRAIVDRYDLFLVDVTGVVHNGVQAYPGAVACLNDLIQKKRVVFLSNNPRPGTLLRRKLESLGIKGSFGTFTSGDATRLFITQQKDKKLFHLGAHRNKDILEGLNVETVSNLEKAGLMLLTAFIEEGEDVAQFDDLLKQAAARNIPILCANPDKVAVHGDTVRSCAGTFAERALAMGASVITMGKPSRTFYEYCPEASSCPKEKILMIGDTLETDILGAQNFKIDSLLVFTGNAGTLLEKSGAKEPSVDFFKGEDPNPTYYMARLG